MEMCEEAHFAHLYAEVLLLEGRLQQVVLECSEAQEDAAGAVARCDTLAGEADSLERQLADSCQGSASLEAELQHARRERKDLRARYDCELTSLRQRLQATFQVNAELQNRCRELEQEASLAQVDVVTGAIHT
mmetsp:Transcript_33794/g.45978  ORF Transcript_33794/g.45978 Transcript_33794/m.45978 type:complete len:133 (+) Transcript_33794:43-441(+)